MTADRKQLITAIHTAKSRNKIDDDTYRDKLRERFSVVSSKDLTDAQLRELLTDLNGGKFYRPKSRKPYVRKIFALWGEMCRQRIPESPNRPGLLAFVQRQASVSDPEFLTPESANLVIEGLKAWQSRVLAERAAKARKAGAK